MSNCLSLNKRSKNLLFEVKEILCQDSFLNHFYFVKNLYFLIVIIFKVYQNSFVVAFIFMSFLVY